MNIFRYTLAIAVICTSCAHVNGAHKKELEKQLQNLEEARDNINNLVEKNKYWLDVYTSNDQCCYDELDLATKITMQLAGFEKTTKEFINDEEKRLAEFNKKIEELKKRIGKS